MSEVPDRTAIADGLRRLRPVIHAWLARDLDGTPAHDPTRAYADLTLAFGFARLGEVNDAQQCMKDADAILSASAHEAHHWLLRLYRYRIDEARRGQRLGGLVPEGVRLPSPDEIRRLSAGQLNSPLLMEDRAATSLAANSRVLNPFDLIGAYEQFLPFGYRARNWEEELNRDPGRLAERVRRLVLSGERMQQAERIRMWRTALGYAAVAGSELVAELLFQLPTAVQPVRAPRVASGHPDSMIWPDTRRLLVVAFDRAARLPDPEHFPPLVQVCIDLLRIAKTVMDCHSALASVGWALLKWLRATGERDAAALFLHDTRDLWPRDKEVVVPSTDRISDELGTALQARLVHTVMADFAGQSEELAALPALVTLLTVPEHGGRPGNWQIPGTLIRCAAQCAAILALDPSPATVGALTSFVERLPRLRDGFTTANWYSRVHFQIAEAVILAFPAVGDF